MVKVVITGVSGLLGSTMARYLVAKGNYEDSWYRQHDWRC